MLVYCSTNSTDRFFTQVQCFFSLTMSTFLPFCFSQARGSLLTTKSQLFGVKEKTISLAIQLQYLTQRYRNSLKNTFRSTTYKGFQPIGLSQPIFAHTFRCHTSQRFSAPSSLTLHVRPGQWLPTLWGLLPFIC